MVDYGEGHPIPQDITGFQFRLIGDMTVKQFAYLAVGLVLGWVAFSLPFPLLIKIPIAAVFVLSGVIVAFVPIQGVPADTMISLFLKALFMPNQYVYDKGGKGAEPVLSQQTATQTIAPSAEPAQQLIHQQPQPKVDQPLAETIPVTTSTPISNPPPPAETTPQAKTAPAEPKKPITIPFVTDVPNLILGIIKDSRGNVLPNVLIEIKDKEDNPVRAFKTNALGQFASATPLLNGMYTITFEDPKKQHRFDIIELTTQGEIIPPLEIVSIDEREELRKSLFETNK